MNRALPLLISLSLAAYSANARVLSIQNSTLSVSYDVSAHEFSLIERATDKTVLAAGQLLDAPVSDAAVFEIRDSTFGKGRQIRVIYNDASISGLELYLQLPFLLIRTSLHNTGTNQMERTEIAPVQFDINLERPVEQLRTLGKIGRAHV